jgi:hypothetical protein
MPSNLRCLLRTICGSNQPSPSRGTSIRTSPIPGEHRLRPVAVAGVPAVAADRAVLVVAQMLAKLLRRATRPPTWSTRSTIRPGRPAHAILTRLRNEFLCQLLLINSSRHRLDGVAHCWSFPAKQRSACRGQLHRRSDSPVLWGAPLNLLRRSWGRPPAELLLPSKQGIICTILNKTVGAARCGELADVIKNAEFLKSRFGYSLPEVDRIAIH